MLTEDFLSHKLQRFSLFDLILVKLVYLILGILVSTNYQDLLSISWIFYLIFALISAFPLYLHFFATKGSYLDKSKNYLRTNKPSYQVLLFLSMFFLGCTLSVLISWLSLISWWAYVILIIILAIKPMRSNVFW